MRGVDAIFLLFFVPSIADAETLCSGRGTSDEVQPIPGVLASFANTLFGEGSAEETVYRCVNDTVYMCRMCNGSCCDKLDANRNIPSVDQYCREHPNSSFVPLAFSGHNSKFSWACAGRRAVVNHVERTDQRGFRADSWMPVAGVR